MKLSCYAQTEGTIHGRRGKGKLFGGLDWADTSVPMVHADYIYFEGLGSLYKVHDTVSKTNQTKLVKPDSFSPALLSVSVDTVITAPRSDRGVPQRDTDAAVASGAEPLVFHGVVGFYVFEDGHEMHSYTEAQKSG